MLARGFNLIRRLPPRSHSILNHKKLRYPRFSIFTTKLDQKYFPFRKLVQTENKIKLRGGAFKTKIRFSCNIHHKICVPSFKIRNKSKNYFSKWTNTDKLSLFNDPWQNFNLKIKDLLARFSDVNILYKDLLYVGVLKSIKITLIFRPESLLRVRQ